MKKSILLFNNIFVLVPIGTALVLALIYTAGGYGEVSPNYTPKHFYLPPLNIWLVILFCFLIVLAGTVISACYKRIMGAVNNQIWVNVAIVFSLATILRLILPIVFKGYMVPFSDYGRIWEITHGKLDGNIEYYTLFPAYLNYSVLQRFIIKLIGDSYAIIIFVNALMGGAIAAIAVLIAYELWKDCQWALVTGLIYACMPAEILYTMIGGPDIFTICLNTLGTLVIIWASKKGDKTRLIGSFVSGVLLGLGASYKSFAIIIIIAIIIAYGAQWLYLLDEGNIMRGWKKSAILIFVCLAVLLTGYKLSKGIILNQTEREFGIQLDERTATPHFILVGLNTQGEGQISEGNLSREYYKYYLDNGMDCYQAKEYAYNILKEDWRNNTNDIPKLFIKKTIWAWQDDVRPALYIQLCINDQGKSDRAETYSLLERTAPELSQAYYVLMLITALAGSTVYAKKKKIIYDIELIELIIFGYFCMIMLSEAQSRYKVLIMPYMSIISCMGLKAISETIRSRRGAFHG